VWSKHSSHIILLKRMFRAKITRRNVKRTSSPLRSTDLSGSVHDVSTNETNTHTNQPEQKNDVLEKKMVNFFDAESAAVSLSKPWLRLERGLRLQKYRTFAESYPSLNAEEKETLYKVLMKANDAKLLNTKQHVQYENGVIQSIKGLKIVRVGDPTVPATFKIDALRATKKNVEE